MKSKRNNWSRPSRAVWTTTPRNEMTFGDVQPSNPMCMRPGYCFKERAKLVALDFGNEMRGTNLKYLPNMDFLDISWSRCGWWCFDFCIEHFEDTLKQCIIDDRKWSMAFKNPAWDEISKFGPIVCRSLGVVRDALRGILNLAFAGFDMADEVHSWIFFTSTGEDDRGVPRHL